tara:strand:- start:511 stop:1272 length:762 start_codon:yes stop_codon:yes gene_type:complete
MTPERAVDIPTARDDKKIFHQRDQTALRGALAILGMHRSGTSALAGTLRAAGVFFGDVLDRALAPNPKGLQEAPSILFMHEDLLDKNHGSWHSPPAELEWQFLHYAVRDLFIESRRSESLWGFKDPRTLITLPGWIEAIPDLKMVGIFRHPAEVAMSIHKRNRFDIDKCFEIWHAYNTRLETVHTQQSFPMIEFVNDQQLMDYSLDKLLGTLGLQPSTTERFYDSDIPQNTRPAIDVPRECNALYQRLQDLSL